MKYLLEARSSHKKGVNASQLRWGVLLQDGSTVAAGEEVEDEEGASGDSKRKKMKEGLASLFGKGPKKDQ